MKNVINYYYNLFPEKIFYKNDDYYFFINDTRYSFVKYKLDEDINEIYNMHLDILRRNIYLHHIILNKNGMVLTIIDGDAYVLMETLYYGNNVSLYNIIPFTKINTESKKVDWAKLWSIKNDYLEFELNEFGLKYPLLRKSFGYFIGLGESSISIVNTLQKQDITYVYAHRRISKKNTTFDLYNPLNIIVDLKVRDTSEYFKQSFFKGDSIDEELDLYFHDTKLTTYEYMMFFARMLYPTYYFDLFEDVINKKCDEKKIQFIIDKIYEYEIILKKIYNFYKSFMNIYPIEWLE